MLMLCAFHNGTLSRTLDLLRKTTGGDAERMALIKIVTEKLESMSKEDAVTLHFEPES
jgi:hypothetical protein